MSIFTIPLGMLETNCYIIQKNKNALVIDPGGTSPKDLSTITTFIKQNKLSIQAILCTHLHYDHIFSTAMLQKQTNVPVFASTKDDFLLKAQAKGGIGKLACPKIEIFQHEDLTEGLHTFNTFSCEVINTPGHTPGGVCLYFKEINTLFTGDTLFYHTVGRTDLPGSNTNDLFTSLHKKIFVLPKDTIVYPGHGPKTSIEEELTNNPCI